MALKSHFSAHLGSSTLQPNTELQHFGKRASFGCLITVWKVQRASQRVGDFLKFKLQLCKLLSVDMLLFASSWAISIHFLVQMANKGSIISWSSAVWRQTGDYVYNRIYLTLIHSCVCFTDPLTGTYSTLRVFRVDIFLPAPLLPSIYDSNAAVCCYFERIQRG